MCSIAGEIAYHGDQMTRKTADRMLATMARRGPDQNGVAVYPQAVLLHSRLSVIDPVGGLQPMHLSMAGEEYCLIYNGELYNTAEVRRVLESLGHRFLGHSDTEVVLHAYAHWGPECLQRFNGIFAFAVWEAQAKQLFMARDRIGVKPLFYTQAGDRFLFASEIKTLLAHPAVEPKVDNQGLAEIFLMGPGRTPGCGVFRDIREVEPGWYGVYEESGLILHRYWRLRDREHRETVEETAEHVEFLVTDAIRRQLVSDVPVATFLSGGLDSSLISAVAASHVDGPLTTFSVDYRDNDRYFTPGKFQPGSDGAYIDIMAKHLNSNHHNVILDTDDLVSSLDEAVLARDLPGMADVDGSMLLLCREMKKEATVGLSGECADEIFGGYPWYRDETIRNTEGFPWAQSIHWRASFLPKGFPLDPEEYVRSRYEVSCRDADVLPGTSPLERRMKEMVHLNLTWFMQTLLDRKDRMSMYSGLEVRVPFCDWRIAEYLYSVPWKFKDYQGREKGLLRYAMRKWLPEEVLWRKKSPYPKTHNPAYLATVSRRLQEVLADPKAPLPQIADRKALEALLDANLTQPWYGQLMTVPQTMAYMLQINHWLEAYNVQIV